MVLDPLGHMNPVHLVQDLESLHLILSYVVKNTSSNFEFHALVQKCHFARIEKLTKFCMKFKKSLLTLSGMGSESKKNAHL